MNKQANLSVVWHVWLRRKENWEKEKSFHEKWNLYLLWVDEHPKLPLRNEIPRTWHTYCAHSCNGNRELPKLFCHMQIHWLTWRHNELLVFIALTQIGWENFRFICMRHRFTRFWVMTQMWCTQKRQKTVCRLRKWDQKGFKAERVRIMTTDVCSGRTNLPLVCGCELIRPRIKFTGNVRSSAMRAQAYEPIFFLIFFSYGFHPFFSC